MGSLASRQENTEPVLPAQNFHIIPGRGVSAVVEGQELLAGNRELMERFKGYLRANGLLRADAAILGIALDDPARTPEAAQRYDVGVVLTGGDPPCGLPVRRIAGVRYAVFEIAHTEAAVAEF